MQNGDLAPLARFPRLKHLGISNTSITDDGIEEITRLAALESLDISGTSISSTGVRRLRELFPALQLRES